MTDGPPTVLAAELVRWSWIGDNLDDDLVRRDFSVNAMAVRITPDGPAEFRDPLGGLAALRAKMLDTPSAPEMSFGDDPLRMLRAARFVSQLGFTVALLVAGRFVGHRSIAWRTSRTMADNPKVRNTASRSGPIAGKASCGPVGFFESRTATGPADSSSCS